MKQRFLGSIVAAALITTTVGADDTLMQRFDKMEKEMNALKAELNSLKAEKAAAAPVVAAPITDKTTITNNDDISKEIDDIKDQLSTINKKTNGNNLKWDVDLRSSVDNLNYKMADGSTLKNDAVFSNRLWLGMSYAATKQLSFIGQLAYNKLYGQRSMSPGDAESSTDGFDWVSGESAYDDTLRLRSAYFLYTDDELAGVDIPWTVSVGRRPSTDGHLINLRDDNHEASPLAHTVNVEFDGASAKFGMDDIIGSTGSYFKLCAGRGMSDAEPRFSSAPYGPSHADTTNIDMGGIILVPYDDKQVSVGIQYTYANNLIDTAESPFNPDGSMNTATYTGKFETVGGLHTATAYVMTNGIGDGLSDFLDDTTFFISGAMSRTNPYAGGQGMLGSMDEETGYSYWLGTQFPSLISDDGRWGLEFNHGSNYWRPITYGEDTMIGSKIAARGDAYEAYFTEPLVDDILTFQLRYTYINYDYTGSNGFFGSNTGTPMAISDVPDGTDMGANAVHTAQDIRAYIRYRF